MHLVKSNVFIFQIISALTLLCLLIFIFKKARRSTFLYTFVIGNFLLIIWTITQVIDINARTYDLMWIAVRIKFIPICFIGFYWLVFSLQYSGYRLIEHKIRIGLLVSPCVLSYFMLLTNPYHHLFYRIFGMSGKYKGIFFWFMSLTTYIYVVIGSVILIKASINNKHVSKKVTGILIAATIIPIIPNALFNAGIINPGFDIAPSSFTFSVILYFVAIYRYKFLNLVPIALKKVFHSVGESIVILDNNNNIIEYNQIFKDITAGQKQDIGVLFGDFFKELVSKENEHYNDELTIPFLNQKIFHANIKPIIDNKGKSLGKIIFMKDITVYKNLMNQLKEKKYQLEKLNQEHHETNLKLKDYLNSVEEMAVASERNRVSTEMHDSLGHAMTQIISLIKISQISYEKNREEAQNSIKQAIDISLESYEEMERTISGVISERYEKGILYSLKKLVDSFRYPDLNIKLDLEGEEFLKQVKYNETIYRICQEGITNAVKHGAAHNMEIKIKADKDKVNILISDDGAGCKSFNNGFGLTGLTKRVAALNGIINFIPGKDSGFIIEASLNF